MEGKQHGWHLSGLIGLWCSSLCLLGLPLLALWLPAIGLGWLLEERIARGLLAGSLILYGLGRHLVVATLVLGACGLGPLN